ncbi:putative cyclin-D6-1-like [Hibiscus syriacus]|uniref:Cyclin-D6-1-like n=1 Tax=Hibiscus syriacus TaxID=106335 RepID=A0A6A2WJK6_HIBSY|nr:putative cyclin-D6-1-like [Hibiscus syriacus]
MSSYHLSELDSTTDSVASSPRSEHLCPQDANTRVRFMCSFGGKILPRPHDNQLCYVGGDTRIVAVHRSTPLSALLTKLSKLSGNQINREQQLLHEDVSVPYTGSLAPGVSVSTSFRSTSGAPTVLPSMPDLRPVKTKPDNTEQVLESKHSQTESFMEQPVSQPVAYSGSPMWHYIPDSHYSAPPVQQIPAFYVPGAAQPGIPPFQPVQIHAQYVQQYPVFAGQIPVGYHQPAPGVGQVYRPVTSVDRYDPALRVAPDGATQPVYYGVRNSGPVPVYPGMASHGGEELARSGSDMTPGRISQSGQ